MASEAEVNALQMASKQMKMPRIMNQWEEIPCLKNDIESNL